MRMPGSIPAFRGHLTKRNISRSNSANTASIPASALPLGVVRSSASDRDTNPTPSAFSSWSVFTKSTADRPQRSSRQTRTQSISRLRDASMRLPLGSCRGPRPHVLHFDGDGPPPLSKTPLATEGWNTLCFQCGGSGRCRICFRTRSTLRRPPSPASMELLRLDGAVQPASHTFPDRFDMTTKLYGTASFDSALVGKQKRRGRGA